MDAIVAFRKLGHDVRPGLGHLSLVVTAPLARLGVLNDAWVAPRRICVRVPERTFRIHPGATGVTIEVCAAVQVPVVEKQ